MPAIRKPAGRPAQGAEAKRHAVSCRVTPKLMARLDDAIAESGRSLAQEIEDRLEFAFRIQDLLGGSERLVFMSFLASRIAAIEEAYDADFTRDKAAWAEVKLAFDAALETVYPPTKNPAHLQAVIEDALSQAESERKSDGA